MPATNAESRKKYKLKNPEKVKESRRKYNAKPKQKVTIYCPCGGRYTAATKSRHVTTDLHVVWDAINPAEDVVQNFASYFGVVCFN